jgi:hypothetical protein
MARRSAGHPVGDKKEFRKGNFDPFRDTELDVTWVARIPGP